MTPAMDPRFGRERRQRLVTRAILAVGFTAAVAVWFAASARPGNPLGYDPLENKRYIHDLEVYGGTANVLATEFREWVAGLWYGKNLAYTIAALTLITVGFVRFLAIPPVDDDSDDGEPPAGPPPTRPAA